MRGCFWITAHRKEWASYRLLEGCIDGVSAAQCICAQPVLRLLRHRLLLLWWVKAAASVTGNHLSALQDFLDHSSTTGCAESLVRAGDVFVPCDLLGRCYLPYWVPGRRRYFQAVLVSCTFRWVHCAICLSVCYWLIPKSCSSRFTKGKSKQPSHDSQNLKEDTSPPMMLFSALTPVPQPWPDQTSTEARGDFPVISTDVGLHSRAR